MFLNKFSLMKMNTIFHKLLLLAVPMAILSSCSEPQFKVEGEIEGGADKSLVLEKSDFHGRWIPVDSTRVKSSGKFAIESATPASPEIYRLSLDGEFIYFPVDSIETITVNAPAEGFGTKFEISGSEQAQNMAAFEKELQQLDASDAAKTDEFKRTAYNKYLKDARGNIFSYYVLTKIVNGKPLYDPESDADAKYYAAVATSFEQFRPNDPHTGMLKQAGLQAMRRRATAQGKKRVVEAEELRLLEIDLPGLDGKNVKLSDIASQGKPTVVIFGMMNEPQSPTLNKNLADIFQSKGGSVNFYQISFDADQYAWREAARNLHWTNVIDPAGQTSDVLSKYNVGALPAFFIYDRTGALADRAISVAELQKKLASY